MSIQVIRRRPAMARARWYRLLLVWWYRPNERPKFRPLLRADFANGDLYEQANFLLHAGYSDAAVFMARVAVENTLRDFARTTAEWAAEKPTKPSITDLSYLLLRQELIARPLKSQLKSFAQRASRVAHGAHIEAWRARMLLAKSSMLRARLEEAMQYAGIEVVR